MLNKSSGNMDYKWEKCFVNSHRILRSIPGFLLQTACFSHKVIGQWDGNIEVPAPEAYKQA